MPSNVTCPECEKDVTLTEAGECPNCGLDVARVLAHVRHQRALEKIEAKRQADEDAKKPKPKPKTGLFGDFF